MPYQGKKQQQAPEENKKARPEVQFVPEQRTFGMPNSLMQAVPMTPPSGTPNSVMREMDPEEYVSFCGTHCDHIVIPEPYRTPFFDGLRNAVAENGGKVVFEDTYVLYLAKKPFVSVTPRDA